MVHKTTLIHETAIIHETAKIDPTAEIGPYTVIGPDTVILQGAKIGSHAVIEHSEIGENCTIFSHASIGFAPQDLKYKNEKTRLILGANCTVREFVTLNRGTAAKGITQIGASCLFMACSHIAHDCTVGNGVILANGVTVGGHVEIGDFAFIGGQAGVHQFTKIGKLAMIGGGSMVTLDIMPFVQAQGDRARLVGLNIVGLHRRGINKSEVDEIKSAYKTLFNSGLLLEEAVDQLEASEPGTEVREMITFIRNSKRGIMRPYRKETNEEL